MNYITHLLHSKGFGQLAHRGLVISRRYGVTPEKMMRAFDQLISALEQHGCRATFPITAVAVARHPAVLEKYQAQGIEFAVHGYTHVNYARLSPEEQIVYLRRARQVFEQAGLAATGFRSPYLQSNTDLYTVLRDVGLVYASNQPVLWDVLDLADLPAAARARYQRAVAYYAPWDACKRVSTPYMLDGLAEIPVSLPDDEILIDRLGSAPDGLILAAWLAMLAESYRRGELLTLQLHPERSAVCAPALAETLRQARACNPAVWCARLDEIATWWRARASTSLTVTAESPGAFRVVVGGPPELTVLARGVAIDALAVPWANGYQQVAARAFTVHAARRPCIGVSAATDPTLTTFLWVQGYPVDPADDAQECALYLDRRTFMPDQEVALLSEIEAQQTPLIRLGRWPSGQRSALAISGDIDALTLWDYALRFVGC